MNIDIKVDERVTVKIDTKWTENKRCPSYFSPSHFLDPNEEHMEMPYPRSKEELEAHVESAPE